MCPPPLPRCGLGWRNRSCGRGLSPTQNRYWFCPNFSFRSLDPTHSPPCPSSPVATELLPFPVSPESAFPCSAMFCPDSVLVLPQTRLLGVQKLKRICSKVISSAYLKSTSIRYMTQARSKRMIRVKSRLKCKYGRPGKTTIFSP